METILSIPVWDGGYDQFEYTEHFVEQVLTKTKGDFVAVIIDNCSAYQRTREFLSAITDSRIHIIYNDKNLGYGTAANQGIEWGLSQGAQYGIVMNNDVEFLDSDWIEHSFVSPLRENPRQFIGARLIDFNESTNYDGMGIVPYLEGWLVAGHRTFWEETGGFDREIFNWHEDVDLSIRAYQLGYEVVQSPDFDWVNLSGIALKQSVLHYYGQTGFKQLDFPTISEISRQYMIRKHFPMMEELANVTQ